MNRVEVLRSFFDRKPQIGMYIGMLFFAISAALYTNVLAYFWTTRTLSQSQMILLNSIAVWVTLASEFPKGIIADKFGRMKVFGIGFILSGLGIMVYVFGRVMALCAIGAVLIGLGDFKMYSPILTWYIGKMPIKAGRRPFMYLGISQCMASVVGGGLGLLIALHVKPQVAVKLILMAAVIKFVGGIILLSILRDNKGQSTQSLINIGWQSITYLKKTPHLIKLSVLLFLQYYIYAIFMFEWRMRGIKLGLSGIGLAYYFCLFNVFLGVGGYMLGIVLRKRDLKFKGMIIAWTMIFIGIMLVLYSKSMLTFNIGFGFFSLGFGALYILFVGWSHLFIPSSYRGAVFTLITAVNFTGGVLFGNLLKLLIKDYGEVVSSIGSVVFVLIAFLIVLSLREKVTMRLDKNLTGGI